MEKKERQNAKWEEKKQDEKWRDKMKQEVNVRCKRSCETNERWFKTQRDKMTREDAKKRQYKIKCEEKMPDYAKGEESVLRWEKKDVKVRENQKRGSDMRSEETKWNKNVRRGEMRPEDTPDETRRKGTEERNIQN